MCIVYILFQVSTKAPNKIYMVRNRFLSRTQRASDSKILTAFTKSCDFPKLITMYVPMQIVDRCINTLFGNIPKEKNTKVILFVLSFELCA